MDLKKVKEFLSEPGWIIVLLFLLVILVWAVLKAFNIINTPVWVEMIPLFSGVFAAFALILQVAVKLGRILQKVDTVCKDVNDMRGTVDKIRINCPKCS